MISNGLYSNEPRPRLCHLRRWPNFIGYGFNLHCEKAKPGQYIGKVDPDSPAESAGLRENDRIVEVNFVPIGNENHKQVVTRIKEGVSRNNKKYTDEVILLVLDTEADAYFKNKSIIVRSADPNVDKRETEIRHAADNGENSPRVSNRSIEKTDSSMSEEISPEMKTNGSNRDYKHVTDFTGPTVTHTKTVDSPVTPRTFDPDFDEGGTHVHPFIYGSDKDKHPASNGGSHMNLSPKSPVKESRMSPGNGSGPVLEMKMSAAEYREKLKAQSSRKRDPRQEQNMSMKEKHDFIDRL